MEAEDPAMMDDAVDDRGGHVPVAEHIAPSAGLEVRGEDDAAGLVAVRAGLEQEAGPVDVDGQVAGLVDDDQPGLADRFELGVQPVLVLGLSQSHDQARGGEEPHGYHALAGEHADRDGHPLLSAACHSANPRHPVDIYFACTLIGFIRQGLFAVTVDRNRGRWFELVWDKTTERIERGKHKRSNAKA